MREDLSDCIRCTGHDVDSERKLSDVNSRLRAFAVPLAVAWVRHQRDRYRRDARAKSLDREVLKSLGPFFPGDVLERSRFVTLRAPKADRPSFFDDLVRFGVTESMFTAFTDVHAITYQDVIVMPSVVASAGNLELVFHELVHVVQFEELGVPQFIDRYVTGWLAAGWRYEGIPLEIDAYALQHRFVAAPTHPFDVKDEVRRRL
jgi:hypothetical protein